MLEKTRVPLQQYRKVVGKLRHSAAILPPGQGLFFPVYKALKGLPYLVPFGNKCESQHNVLDLKKPLKDASTRPKETVQLVKIFPDFVGYTNACATRMGAVWFSGNKNLDILCCRVQFPKDIVDEEISYVNTKGMLTNSDLELAASLVHYDVLVLNTDMRIMSSAIFSDNTPMVARCTKIADSSRSPVAGGLLRGSAMLQHQELSAPVLLTHVAGYKNKMADYLSR